MPSRDERKATFKKAYKEYGSIMKASEATGIGRRTHYDWLKADEEYKAAFEDTKDDFAEAVENVMFDRIFHDPKCHHVLIIFALKGLMKDKYGDKPMEIAGEEDDVFLRLSRISSKAKRATATLVKELHATAGDPLSINADALGENEEQE